VIARVEEGLILVALCDTAAQVSVVMGVARCCSEERIERAKDTSLFASNGIREIGRGSGINPGTGCGYARAAATHPAA